MLSVNYVRSTRYIRSISCSIPKFNETVPNRRPSPKEFSEKDPKILSKRLQQKRAKFKQPPQSHKLYMEVPQIMKYLRAAEVGQPTKKTTVALQVAILPEKGSIPLLGKIFFPKPIKDNKAIVFTSLDSTRDQILKLDDTIVVGGSELIDEIQLGAFDLSRFNQSYATPEMVPFLKPVGRILGTKGLMPTAKRGTVSDDLVHVLELNFGAFNFKEKNNMLSIPVGRCDFSDEEIIRNIQAASEVVYACQPAGTKKPSLIGKCYISSTLGPSAVIDFRN